MDERHWYRCHHDGLGHGAMHDSYDRAWIELHKLQPQSASWAFTEEGWSIERVLADGTIVTETDNEEVHDEESRRG